MAIDYADLLEKMHPGFFQSERIRALPPEQVYHEMVLELGEYSDREISVPEGVTFGEYHGDFETLRARVRQVNPGWADYFGPDRRVYCGFMGGEAVSFCLVDDMGVYKGLRIAGPGCVGTLREHRRRGIGLKMVEHVTRLLRDEGYDLSYIHYTGVADWYAKLGYRTVLRWNCDGIMR